LLSLVISEYFGSDPVQDETFAVNRCGVHCGDLFEWPMPRGKIDARALF